MSLMATVHLSDDDIREVAELARLGIPPDMIPRYREQLTAILEHVSRLSSVDASTVEETAQVGGLLNAWREDATRPSLPVEDALAAGPSTRGDHFLVGAIQE